MYRKKNIPEKSKKKVRKKRDISKSTKKLFEQKIYIGPGQHCEKTPKGQTAGWLDEVNNELNGL